MINQEDNCRIRIVYLVLFFFISNVESKTGTLEQQSRFALECDILFSPLSQLLNFPLVQSLLDRKYGHMDFFNVSPTFPYLLTSCCLHLQCRIEYIGLGSKKSGFALILFAAQHSRSSPNYICQKCAGNLIR